MARGTPDFGVVWPGASFGIKSTQFKAEASNGEAGAPACEWEPTTAVLGGALGSGNGPLVCFLNEPLRDAEDELVLQAQLGEDGTWVDLCTLSNDEPSSSCPVPETSAGGLPRLRATGRECRICFEPAGACMELQLVAPCECRGSSRWVHRGCLTRCGRGRCDVCQATLRAGSLSDRQLHDAVVRATAQFDADFGIPNSETVMAPFSADSPRHHLPLPPAGDEGAASNVNGSARSSLSRAATMRVRGHRRTNSREFECDVNIRGHRRTNSRELERRAARSLPSPPARRVAAMDWTCVGMRTRSSISDLDASSHHSPCTPLTLCRDYEEPFPPGCAPRGQYTGEVDAESRPHGKGVWVNGRNETEYDGEYRHGKRHGRGTAFRAGIEVEYVGEWHRGKRDGKGRGLFRWHLLHETFLWEGRWHSGRPRGGTGTLFLRDGSAAIKRSSHWRWDGRVFAPR